MNNPYRLELGNCLELITTLPDASIDAVITDPPYPEISREYGRMTEPQWHAMMDQLIPEIRRVLKPTGSAVFVLQPNSEHVGQMRLWLWEFVAKWGRAWNLVQDAYWFNCTALPTVGASRKIGLMRPSVKFCVWLGNPDCYRNQDEILNPVTERMIKGAATRSSALRYTPSGGSKRDGNMDRTAIERGGSTPFNLVSMSNHQPITTSIHGARTPYKLASHWARYLCPAGGTILDPFAGVATIGLAALKTGRRYIGFEMMPEYYEAAQKTLQEAL